MSNTPKPAQKYYTLADAARILGLTPAALTQMANEGRIKTVMMPNGNKRAKKFVPISWFKKFDPSQEWDGEAVNL